MARRLSIVGRAPADSGADALRALAVALAPHLRELLDVERADADLVEVAAVVPLPRRAVLRACREGRIDGARRVGRRWLATRAAVTAWVHACGPIAVPTPPDDGDELDELRSRLASPRPRSRRTG